MNRIAANSLAIWGRNVIAMVFGLFSSRWTLMALGADGLGLYGALMGLMAFAGLIGGVMQLSMVRSMSISAGRGSEHEIHDLLRVSMLLSLIFAALLLLAALPCGEFYVRRFMSMDEGFRPCAVWTWRLVVMGAIANAFAMPCASLLTARQRFPTLAAVGLVQTIVNFALAAFMLFGFSCHSSPRILLVFGIGNAVVAIAVSILTMFVAGRRSVAASWNLGGVPLREMLAKSRELVRYAACELWSGLGDVVRRSGTALYLNNAFGGSSTAAWGIGNTVNVHATSLSSAVLNAFMPAAMKGGTAGLELALSSARWGFFTTAVFAVPFCFMSEQVVRLWLGKPPEGAAFFAAAIVAGTMIQRVGNAQHLVVMEKGRVALYHVIVGTTSMLTLGVAVWICASIGYRGAGWAVVVSFIVITLERVVLGRMIADVGILHWARAVLFPCALFALAMALLSFIVMKVLELWIF